MKEDVLSNNYLIAVKFGRKLWLRSVKTHIFKTVVIFMLYVTMREARVRVVLGVVKQIEIPELIETAFLVIFIRGKFCKERKDLPLKSKTIVE